MLLKVTAQQLPNLRTAGDEALAMPVGVKSICPLALFIGEHTAQAGDISDRQIQPQPPDVDRARCQWRQLFRYGPR